MKTLDEIKEALQLQARTSYCAAFRNTTEDLTKNNYEISKAFESGYFLMAATQSQHAIEECYEILKEAQLAKNMFDVEELVNAVVDRLSLARIVK